MNCNNPSKLNSFNILKPQPSPKSIRKPLSNITNNMEFRSCQNINQAKLFNNQLKIITNKDQIKQLNQYSQKSPFSHRYTEKKSRSLQSKQLQIQLNQGQSFGQNCKKRKNSLRIFCYQDRQQFYIQKQSKMLKQIRQFLFNASQTGKRIKQKQKSRQIQLSNQFQQKQKIKRQIQQQRNRILQQIKSKYHKELQTLQFQMSFKRNQNANQMVGLKQNTLQLEQILADIQNNISNLHSFEEQEFRSIMDHYWQKIQSFQRQLQDNYGSNRLSYKSSPSKLKSHISRKLPAKNQNKEQRNKVLLSTNLNCPEIQINFSGALKKVKTKSKLQMFSEQLKKAISDLQKSAQVTKGSLDKSEQETSRFNDSHIEQLCLKDNRAHKSNKQFTKSIQQIGPVIFSFKKPIQNFM